MTTLDLETTPEREIRDLAGLGLPGARVLGRYRYRTPHTPLPPHRHRGMIEICYLHRGRQGYEMSGRRYDLQGGEVLVTMPGEWHSTGPDPENRGVLYWLILAPAAGRGRFLGLPPTDSTVLTRALLTLPARHFRAPRGCHAALDALLTGTRRTDALDVIARRCALVALLLDLVRASGRRRIRGADEWLDPVLHRMRTQLDRNWQVPDFARVAGLSVSHFTARFRDVTGTGPAEYFLGLRIDEAKRRLADTTASVTRIAYDLGFGSSQSFATAFHRLVGCAPSAHRRAAAR
ncbi:MAG: helix-turn-helix transcriptional regulator [Acidobacteria bacterium]|nr:helix-turn-helix transcriptional regulator [Acidobacteriota bacterium]